MVNELLWFFFVNIANLGKPLLAALLFMVTGCNRKLILRHDFALVIHLGLFERSISTFAPLKVCNSMASLFINIDQ